MERPTPVEVLKVAAVVVFAVIGWVLAHRAFDPAAIRQRIAATQPLNERCPVLPEEPASPEHQVVHRGRVVALCCDSCVETFRANPDGYLAALGAPPRSIRDRFDALALWVNANAFITVYLGLVGLAYYLARRIAPREGARGARAHRIARHPATLVIAAQLGLLIHVLGPGASTGRGGRAPAGHQTDVSEAFVGLQLARWAALFGHAEAPGNPFVRTFYRGNDERNDRLGLGGRYRTADMKVALLTEDGTPFAPGMKPADHRLSLRLEIVRAPFTTDQLFTSRIMSRVVLTRSYDAAPDDAVHLTTVEPGERWDAVYPIPGHAFVSGTTTVLVRILRAIHYAVLVDIVLDADGAALPESSLVIGAVINVNVPRAEWLSAEPIPVLTAPNDVSAQLHGIPDYDHLEDEPGDAPEARDGEPAAGDDAPDARDAEPNAGDGAPAAKAGGREG